MLLLYHLYRRTYITTSHSNTRSSLLQSCFRPLSLVSIPLTSFPVPAFNASVHDQVIDEKELVDMEMGWSSITQGLENITHILSRNLVHQTQEFQRGPQIPLNEMIDIQRRFSKLNLEISTLTTLYVLNLHRYHDHTSKIQKSLQSSHLTERQWTDLKGRYEALFLLSANIKPEKAAWTKWVDASKSHDDARRGLDVFEDEFSRLGVIRARANKINRNLDC